ncbi:mono/diheme cytochrome c family protein [Breoghania corrubedonensis]|uniref:Mono/diheme cytochrome c family protein n=1 Tax=Breoghania corrubedonensis TaxID=665038 RepID=A0A2T5VD16_9HYPH|nr:cytochrome c [Breoghania corrubedonensis]PTW61626.1 mono/diheme cytochrome c family protein [Breoghania corrubedonensis]
MRSFIRLVIVLAVIGAAGFYWLTIPERIYPSTLPEHEADLANGARLFWAGGCGSCHAKAKATGEEKLKLGGGQELVTPFGTFRVPNISPDTRTGIGGWSKADFVTAMVKGVSPDGRHYYPAFPYTSYQHMRETDLIDLKGFLDGLPAVSNVVGPHDLSFPYTIRRGLGLWKLLYLDGKTFEPDPDVSDEINRGAYLVTGPGHCGECHTPRDFIGGLRMDRWLAGGPAPEGDGFVPNLTPDPSGLGAWSKADIAYALETGFTPDYDTLGGSMTSVQENMAHLPGEDRAAIAAYLKSIPPLPSEKSGK